MNSNRDSLVIILYRGSNVHQPLEGLLASRLCCWFGKDMEAQPSFPKNPAAPIGPCPLGEFSNEVSFSRAMLRLAIRPRRETRDAALASLPRIVIMNLRAGALAQTCKANSLRVPWAGLAVHWMNLGGTLDHIIATILSQSCSCHAKPSRFVQATSALGKCL